ncbi:hypothetical protein, partial [Micromonospora sp. CPCC 206061]|uniref:hypothetical protein n=1 Tax=Micromonospora sp. CPCC 206061 TaxID=3122410 RepID=UPI002FF2ADD1
LRPNGRHPLTRDEHGRTDLPLTVAVQRLCAAPAARCPLLWDARYRVELAEIMNKVGAIVTW